MIDNQPFIKIKLRKMFNLILAIDYKSADWGKCGKAKAIIRIFAEDED